MKGTYRVLALLVPILVIFQAFVIGLEIFGLGSWVDSGGHDFTKSVLESDNSPVTGAIGGNLHGMGAIALLLVGLVLLIVSFFAKIEGGVKWAAWVFLDIVVQWALAFLAFGVAWQFGALHPVNAFILAGLGFKAYSNAKRSSVAAPATAPTSTPA
jgi:hypothetical protein